MIIVCAWCNEKKKGADEIWAKTKGRMMDSASRSASHGICPDCARKLRADLRAAYPRSLVGQSH